MKSTLAIKQDDNNSRQQGSSDCEMMPSVAKGGTTESDMTTSYKPMYSVGAETTSDRNTDDGSKLSLSLPLVATIHETVTSISADDMVMQSTIKTLNFKLDMLEKFHYLKQGRNALKKSNVTEGIGATEQHNALKLQCHTKPLEFGTHRVQQAIGKAIYRFYLKCYEIRRCVAKQICSFYFDNFPLNF
ncbi:hypothetical protein ACROYT_G014678 [Oculina patagonica]